MHELADQLFTCLKATWRFRSYAVAAAWLIALAGWAVVYRMPDRYEAQARVYVDTQSMLRPLLSGLAVQPNVDQMIAMMGRTLVSRPNMEKLIDMTGMASGIATAEDHERLIARLAKELAIKSTGRENLYTIAYSDQNRELAKRVVQSALTIFMQGGLGDKRKDSESARQFIEDQLSSYSEKLVAAENAVTAFKRKHQGLMPGGGQDYYARLSEARAALRQAALELREAVNSRDAIKQQLAGDAQISSRAEEKGAASRPASETDLRIRTLEQRLDGLRLTYTEQHPDVIATLRTLAQLKEQKAAEDKSAKPGPRATQGPAYEKLAVSLATAEANVAAMRARVEEYDTRYNELQAAANALPQIEAEFKQLNRDYEVIKARYDKLLERRESAQISGDLEASDSAMGFRVVDPPQAPLTPTAPNRPLLISLVLLAALGGGFGLAYLLSQGRRTFDDERTLGEASGLPVLGTIAMVWTDQLKKRRARGLLALLFSILGLLSAYAAMMASVMMAASRA
jgi:polysaccharide chain length determinant protein (PEP-CTERM system associated)